MKKFLAFIIVAVSCFGAQHAFAGGPFTATTSQTASSFTINYHYAGIPTQTIKVYSWLTNTVTGVWVDRSNLLLTIPASSSTVTKDFSVTYDFTALGLTGNGTKYAYYLADGTTDSANLLYGAANFTVGTAPVSTFTFTTTQQYTGTTTGTYQQGFTVTPKTTLTDPVTLSLQIAKQSDPTTIVSQSDVTVTGSNTVSPGTDDLPPGAYVANLMQGTTNVGTVNFTLVSQLNPFSLVVSDILAPSTTVTIKGTISAVNSTQVPNSHLVVKIGTSLANLNTVETAFSGTITSSGTPFNVSVDSLDPTQTYYYKFTETTTGIDLTPTGSFVLNKSQNQASGGAQLGDNDGMCNPTYDTTVQSPITASISNLCSNGTLDGFAGDPTNGPWTWKCDAVATGGATDSCTATLITTGPACATGPFTTSTPTSSLCAVGTMSNLVNTTSNWTWSCNLASYTAVTCAQTVTQGTSTQTPSTSNPATNFLANPLSSSLNTFPKILAAVMNNIVLPIMIPFISIMLIYCGFLFVVARKNGSTDGYANAKKTLMYTIIGAALVLGATVVSSALQGTLNDILGPSGSSTTTTTTK